MMQDYKIHGTTIFIKDQSNSLVSQYQVHGDQVSKIVQHYSGDELIVPFYTFGELPVNTEHELLKELREKGEL